MTCRHRPGDPDCSSHPDQIAKREAQYERESRDKLTARIKELEERIAVSTHDAENYEIVEFHREGRHLLLKVKYPNCSKCLYEGMKVMVFLNVTEAQVIRWRRIDPHFRAPVDPQSQGQPWVAPSPAARFPGSLEGWIDAVAYIRSKAAQTDEDRSPYAR